jgi:hypothetical protein
VKARRFMRRLILIVGLTVAVFYSNATWSSEVSFLEESFGMCNDKRVGDPLLFYNLSQFMCMSKAVLQDSAELSIIAAEAGQAIASEVEDFKDVRKWGIWAEYAMQSHRNIVFLLIPNPSIPDFRYTVAWNRSQNKYYVLGAADPETFNSLLSSEEFVLFSDYQYLEFCWLITSLRNPHSNIRFISSIKEILVEAAFTNSMFRDLSQVSDVEEDIVKIPSIDRSWYNGPFDSRKLREMVPGVDTARVEFYMAKEEDIVEVRITLSGQKVVKYEEEKVGETIDWFGRRL